MALIPVVSTPDSDLPATPIVNHLNGNDLPTLNGPGAITSEEINDEAVTL